VSDDETTNIEKADQIIEAANEFLEQPNEAKADAVLSERAVLAMRNLAVAIKQQLKEREQ
jgi:hypothetical protein